MSNESTRTTASQRQYFHRSIISFITSEFRLSKWHWLSLWREFNPYYCCPGYELYTAEDLLNEFRNIILPQIFTYDLLPEERKKFDALSVYQVCGPEVHRTETGYKIVSISNHLKRLVKKEFQEGVHYVKFGKTGGDPENLVAVEFATSEQYTKAAIDVGGDLKVHRSISLMLQNKNERLQQLLLPWREIRERTQRDEQPVASVQEIMDDVTFIGKLEMKKRERYYDRRKRLLIERRQQVTVGSGEASLQTPPSFY